MAGDRFSQLEVDKPGGDPGDAPRRVDGPGHMEQARRHALAGRHEQALSSYTAALRENPLLVDAWVGQLWMLLDLGEYPEARLWADKALAAFPDHPDLVGLKSLALWRFGKERTARDMNDTALEKKQDSTSVWLARAEMLAALGSGAADGCCEHAVNIAGDDVAWVQLRVGQIRLAARHYLPAALAFEAALKRYPEAAWAWYGLGQAQQNLGRLVEAKQAFQRARRLAPTDKRFRYDAPPPRKGGWWTRLFGGGKASS